MMQPRSQGFSTPLIILIIVVFAAGGAWLYMRGGIKATALPQATPTSVRTTPPSSPGVATSTASLLDFTTADFEAAKSSNKLIVLYFYANWCPLCRAEFPIMQQAFTQITHPNVIGFRVNYNDNETDAFEQELAREHGVAYQHTKVFVKNGQRVLKSPETWDLNRYLTEINQAAGQ